MTEYLGNRSDAGRYIFYSVLVAVFLLLIEAFTGTLGSGASIPVALVAGLAVSGLCGYRGGGYVASLVCGYLPLAAHALGIAAQNAHIEYASAAVYHALWSFGVLEVPLATLGFVIGFSTARKGELRAHAGYLLLTGGIAVTFTTLLWLTCSPFTSWPCGTVYQLL